MTKRFHSRRPYSLPATANYSGWAKDTGRNIQSLTWRNYEDFYLDDNAPWDTTKEPYSVKLPTALTRNYWMSPAIHRLTHFKERGFSQAALLEMLLLSSYQTNWARFWVVTERMLLVPEDNPKLTSHPSKVYCCLANELFGSWIGGNHRGFLLVVWTMTTYSLALTHLTTLSRS